jgi:hypothetical protein
LFFEAFEIGTRTNVFLSWFFSKIWNQRFLDFKIFKELESAFLKKFKELTNTIHIMFTSNYFLNGPRVLPWYNLGFTQFLIHGHNKLMITQIQCSQGYKNLVEKFWLRKSYSKSCQVWTMVGYRLELQTLGRNCVLRQSFLFALSFLWVFVVPSP